MKKYRKKPVVIEAIRYEDETAQAIVDWVGEAAEFDDQDRGIVIRTLEGDHLALRGDWIIRGVAGEFYPCKPDIFQATYEPA
jgi:hypothetical protein